MLRAAIVVCVCSLLCWTTDAQITGWTGDVTVANAAGGNGTVTKPETTTGTLFTVKATPTAPGGAVTYDFVASTGNPSSIANATITNGVVTLASGQTLDFEGATNPLIFSIVGTETGQTPVGTVTVTLSITDVAEFSDTSLTACIPDQSPSGTTVGTYTISAANTATPHTPVYSISGTDASSFSINATHGVLTTKGATIKTSYSVDIEATNTKTGKGKVALTVTVPCSAAEKLTSILAVIAMAAAAARLF